MCWKWRGREDRCQVPLARHMTSHPLHSKTHSEAFLIRVDHKTMFNRRISKSCRLAVLIATKRVMFDFKPPNIIQNDGLKSFNIDEKAPVNYDPMVKQVMFNDKMNIVTSSRSNGMVHTDKVTHALNMVNSPWACRTFPWGKEWKP